MNTSSNSKLSKYHTNLQLDPFPLFRTRANYNKPNGSFLNTQKHATITSTYRNIPALQIFSSTTVQAYRLYLTNNILHNNAPYWRFMFPPLKSIDKSWSNTKKAISQRRRATAQHSRFHFFFTQSSPVQSSQSSPVQSSPVQSSPVQSSPVQSSPYYCIESCREIPHTHSLTHSQTITLINFTHPLTLTLTLTLTHSLIIHSSSSYLLLTSLTHSLAHSLTHGNSLRRNPFTKRNYWEVQNKIQHFYFWGRRKKEENYVC